MNKEKTLVILAFIIPAVIAFLSFKYSELFIRILFAIPYGLVYGGVASLIRTGASEEFRTKEPVSEKVGMLTSLVSLPVVFYCLIHFYKTHGRFYGEDKASSAWASVIIAILVSYVLKLAVKFIIKMFEK